MIARSSELYWPTMEDRERVRIKLGKLLLSGDGIFATCQGEGVSAGKEAVFVRTHLCNLACGRDSGWQCDTNYTWDQRTAAFWREPKSMNPDVVAAEINRQWQLRWGARGLEKRVVFTGGEPLLQQRMLVEVISQLQGYQVEFETNGTVVPIPEIAEAQFNCSPKLSNSGNPEERRYRPSVLSAIAQLPNSYFKFVVTGASDFQEIDAIVAQSGMSPNRVLIMPEGQSPESIKQKAAEYQPLTHERGYQITRRYQLEWFGDKRGT